MKGLSPMGGSSDFEPLSLFFFPIEIDLDP